MHARSHGRSTLPPLREGGRPGDMAPRATAPSPAPSWSAKPPATAVASAADSAAALPAGGGDSGAAERQGKADSAADRGGAGASKSVRVAAVEQYLTTHAASHVAEPQRNASFRRAADELAQMYPQLASILFQVNRYLKEIGQSQQRSEAAHAQSLKEQERALYAKFESFFEEKICAILRDKKNTELAAQQLHRENYSLREERDEELTAMKNELIRRLDDCERREDEFRSFRELIASVFKTNEQLTVRVEDLELLLAKHGIQVPPASQELFQYSRQRRTEDGGKDQGPAVDGQSNSDEARQQRREVALGTSKPLPAAFMKASKGEIDLSRLTLQEELLHCAFDDRSAYRLQITGLKQENTDLKFQVSTLRTSVESLNRYIHEKRFLTYVVDDDGNAARPLTPRPREVPFAIETELGVDLKRSTSDIVAELAAVATNLKHQLNSALLRLRQAAVVSEWMQEETLIELNVERTSAIGVLPTFPISAWTDIPHFLRTNISPDVDNLGWSQSDIAAVLLTFFRRFHELREECRFIRDSKMLAPRTHQLFERREILLTRLDATKEELQREGSRGVEAVPFGYVVSHFVRDVLMELTTGSKSAALLLPGTLHPRFVIRGEERVIELEFTRFAYNIWWACQRYRLTQPLCRLFLDVVNGRLPVDVFEQTEKVVASALRYTTERLDTDGSHTFPYNRLVQGVAKLVADMDASAGRCGVLAVVQTFEENQVPVVGGRVRLEALVADESYCVPEPQLGSDNLGSARPTAGTASNLPPSITARCVPGWQLQPLGSSIFVRYWRRLVLDRYETVYTFVERAMAPLVVESDAVLGLFLLPVPAALARAEHFDEDDDARAADLLAPRQTLFFPNDSALPVQESERRAQRTEEPVSPAYEAATRSLPAITRSYEVLLKNRKTTVLARRAARHVLLASIVPELMNDLPRLHEAVHFPFDAQRTAPPLSASETRPDGSPAPARELLLSAGSTVPDGAAAAAVRRTPQPGKKAKAAKAGKKTPKPLGAANRRPQGEQEGLGRTSSRRAFSATRRKRTVGDDADDSKLPTSTPSEDAVRGGALFAADGNMVEWYGFCAALRSRTLTFSESVFQESFSPAAERGGASPAVEQQRSAGSDSEASAKDEPVVDEEEVRAPVPLAVAEPDVGSS